MGCASVQFNESARNRDEWSSAALRQVSVVPGNNTLHVSVALQPSEGIWRSVEADLDELAWRLPPPAEGKATQSPVTPPPMRGSRLPDTERLVPCTSAVAPASGAGESQHKAAGSDSISPLPPPLADAAAGAANAGNGSDARASDIEKASDQGVITLTHVDASPAVDTSGPADASGDGDTPPSLELQAAQILAAGFATPQLGPNAVADDESPWFDVPDWHQTPRSRARPARQVLAKQLPCSLFCMQQLRQLLGMHVAITDCTHTVSHSWAICISGRAMKQ